MTQNFKSPMEEQLYLLMLENIELRARRLVPFRQIKFGKYYADFYFPKVQVILEYDGKAYHTDSVQALKDVNRDVYFEKLGIKTYRIYRTGAFFTIEERGEMIASTRTLEMLVAVLAGMFKDYWPETTSEF